MNAKGNAHNREMVSNAEFRASYMKYNPSPLEEKMADILNRNWIMYESQKVFYIYSDDGYILKYYIADFFVPKYNLIIEVDGKFHDKHKQHDKMRTKEIQSQYPNVEVLRFKWEDLNDMDTMERLIYKLHR